MNIRKCKIRLFLSLGLTAFFAGDVMAAQSTCSNGYTKCSTVTSATSTDCGLNTLIAKEFTYLATFIGSTLNSTNPNGLTVSITCGTANVSGQYIPTTPTTSANTTATYTCSLSTTSGGVAVGTSLPITINAECVTFGSGKGKKLTIVKPAGKTFLGCYNSTANNRIVGCTFY